jgi:hypothetical protein
MTDLEKVLAQAHYTALPLPREKSAPTTIFSFHDGQLFVVRDPHTCLPDPPLAVTVDAAVDTIQFQREFQFDVKGIISFVLKVFSLGKAKAELATKDVKSATVVMGGLQHETIQTGQLIDYLMTAPHDGCLRDIVDDKNFTVIAALRASTFTYTFHGAKGASVSLTLPEAEGLFKADASVNVSVTTDGKVVVTAPRYVGVVTWKGDVIAKQVEKARKFAQALGAAPYQPPNPFALSASTSDIMNARLATLAATGEKRAASAPQKTGVSKKGTARATPKKGGAGKPRR